MTLFGVGYKHAGDSRVNIGPVFISIISFLRFKLAEQKIEDYDLESKGVSPFEWVRFL